MVAPELFEYAVKRSGKELEELERQHPKLRAWMEQDATPSLRQLQNFAASTHTPLGYFFLPAPPAEPLPIQDFRTQRAEALRQPSGDLLDTIYLCQQRQAWYEEFAREEGLDAVALVGSLTLRTPVEEAARHIATAIAFDREQRRHARSWQEALSQMIHAVDEAGILIMVSGVVGSNSHRKLDPDEFRGFALADPLAPLIFVNGADSKSAQMFTIAHELAHLALGTSALTDGEAGSLPNEETERWCNAVAAEMLAPLEEVRAALRPEEPIDNVATRLARWFKVSSLVILRRLWDARVFRTLQAFRAAYDNEVARWQEQQAKGGGGDYYASLEARVGKRFEYAIVADTLSGRTPFTQAFRLLGMQKQSTFDKLAKRLGLEG